MQLVDESNILMLSSTEKLGSQLKSTNVTFLEIIGDDAINLLRKVLSFIRKSWTVQKGVIQSFDIKTKITNMTRHV